MAPEGSPTQYHIMPPKKLRSVVVSKNKWAREVVQTSQDQELPTKRTQSAGLDSDIIMTITQPANISRCNKNTHKPKTNPTHPRAKEAGISHSTVSFAHPTSGMQHASNAVPTPGQHQCHNLYQVSILRPHNISLLVHHQ